MCYSGECFFEAGGDHAGDCMVGNHAKFQQKYGMTPCAVGGFPGEPVDEEDISFSMLRDEEIKQIRSQWLNERFPQLANIQVIAQY